MLIFVQFTKLPSCNLSSYERLFIYNKKIDNTLIPMNQEKVKKLVEYKEVLFNTTHYLNIELTFDMYELKDYLNAINLSKKNLLGLDDTGPPFKLIRAL